MLKDLNTIAELIQKVAATAALLVGGYWVLMNYRRNRTHVTRLQPLVSGEILEGPAGRQLLVSIEIRNPGQSKIELGEKGELHEGTSLLIRPLLTAADPLSEPAEEEETAFEILAYRKSLEPGLAWYEQKLISIPDATIHAFHLRLRVVARDETFTVTAIAIAKQPPHATSRSA
jgi:hypothetical protein